MNAKLFDKHRINVFAKSAWSDVMDLQKSISRAAVKGWFNKHEKVQSSLNILEVYNNTCNTIATLEKFRDELRQTMKDAIKSVPKEMQDEVNDEISKLNNFQARKEEPVADKMNTLQVFKNWFVNRVLR